MASPTILLVRGGGKGPLPRFVRCIGGRQERGPRLGSRLSGRRRMLAEARVPTGGVARREQADCEARLS